VPLGYIAVFVVLALQVGLPPGGVVFWALANSLMVGLSEEWMCRGILLRGLEDGTGSLRKAVWGSSVLFGAVHSLNVFVTGDLVPGLIQSGAAFMSGLLFCALRLRTGSLLPVIAVHGLWDASLFIMAQAMAVKGAEKTASAGAGMFAPMLLVLPNFLYALYLLRKVGRDVPAGGAEAVGR
jgi:hypothetical protein